MSRPHNFDVLKAMSAAEGKIYLAPLGNIIRMQAVKAGAQVTIGVERFIMDGLASGQFYGGLVLVDKEEFELTAREIETAQREE